MRQRVIRRVYFSKGVLLIRVENVRILWINMEQISVPLDSSRDVVWINAKKPSTWNEEIYNQLNEAWRSSEHINIYFEKEKTVLEKNRQILDSIQLLSAQQKKVRDIQGLQRQIDSIKMDK